jgi:hypothetical protein
MRTGTSLAALTASALVLALTPVYAQRATAPSAGGTAVEVTPYVSLGSAQSSRIGGAVAFAVTDDVSVEAEVGYRGGGADILATNVSLLYHLPGVGRVRPYVASGIGLEEHLYAEGSPVGPIAYRRTGFAVNAGGGLKIPVADRWGLRTDARWFNGVGRTAPERWRLYNGVTFGTGGR